MQKVFVVVWCNYGDQGVAFMGVFKTRESAENWVDRYIESKGYDRDEKRWFDINEEEVQE